MDSRLQIEACAADWIARRDNDTWSEAEQAELSTWLEASPAHMVEFLRLEAAWEEANRLKAMGSGVPSGVIPSLEQWRASPFFRHAPRTTSPVHAAAGKSGGTAGSAETRSRWFVPYGLAACLLLALGAILWHQGLFDRNRYTTPIGGVASVPMEDGSTITLSSNSQVRVAVTQTQRRVELEHGEAFFDVVKDKSRPFVVDAGDRRIVAVGTQFSVRRDRDDVRIIVTEGAVRIERASTKDTLVDAGTVARARPEALIVQKKPTPELEEALSWRFGYVVFHSTPLAEAVAEFNRYNPRRIIIEDPELATIPISGNFRATNVDAFVRLLRDAFAVRAQENGSEIVLSH